VYSRTSILLFLALIAHVHPPIRLAAQQDKWLTVYLPVWSQRPLGEWLGQPAWEIDWTGITHVVHFNNTNVSKTDPYYTPAYVATDSIELFYGATSFPGCYPGCPPTHYQDSLIAIAHRNNVRVILNLSALGSDGEKALAYVAADSARMQRLVDVMVAFGVRHGYDGVEVDWEPPSNRNDMSRLIRLFRARLNSIKPRGLLFLTANYYHFDLYDSALVNAMVDQVNLMMYDYCYAWKRFPFRYNVIWYNAPLYSGSECFWTNSKTYETMGPLQWIAAGHNRTKLGIGIPFYGYIFHNHHEICTPFKIEEIGYISYQNAIRLLRLGGTEEWDDHAKVPYISGTATETDGPWPGPRWNSWGVQKGQEFFVTYEDPHSIAEKVKWMKAQNLGGLMIYDLTMDFDATKPLRQRHPLLKTAVNTMKSDKGSR
jgi:spore germination protein YaaH